MCMMPGAAPSAMHRWGMRRRCQLGVACFVGVQNNGNMKSINRWNISFAKSQVEDYFQVG